MSKIQIVRDERKNLIDKVTKLYQSLENGESEEEKMHDAFNKSDKLKLNHQLVPELTKDNTEKQSLLDKPEDINNQDWQQAGPSRADTSIPINQEAQEQ